MNTIVILTGPYGADIKFFNKLLTQHADVCDLSKQSPQIEEMWGSPNTIPQFDWTQSRYYVTAVTCPTPSDDIPKYFKFINELQKLDFRVVVAIVGQHQSSLTKKQKKQFGRKSTDEFIAEINNLAAFGPIYVSEVLATAYKDDYLRFLQNYLKIPLLLEPTDPEVTTSIVEG